MMSNDSTIRAIFFLYIIVSSSCHTYKPITTNIDQKILVQKKFPIFPKAIDTTNLKYWWYVFNSKQLNYLVENALKFNLTIKHLAMMVEAAKIDVTIDESNKWPVLSALWSSKKLATRQDKTIYSNNNSFGIELDYNLDVFNTVDKSISQQRLKLQLSLENLRKKQINIITEIVIKYFMVSKEKHKLIFLSKDLEANNNLHKIISTRITVGRSSALELYQLQQDILATKLLIKSTQTNISSYSNDIKLLSNLDSEYSLIIPSRLSKLSNLISSGSTTDLLKNSYVIRTAFINLRIADIGVALAEARQLPNFYLGTQVNISNDNLASFFNPVNMIAQVFANISQTLFDGSNLSNQSLKAKKQVLAYLFSYRKALIEEYFAVNKLIMLQKNYYQQVFLSQKRLSLATQATKLAKSRFIKGIIDYQSLLQIFSIQNTSQKNLVDKLFNLISSQVHLLAKFTSIDIINKNNS